MHATPFDFYYIPISLSLRICILLPPLLWDPPLGTPRLGGGPSLRFAVVCHHLFLLTNKCWPSVASRLAAVTHRISCSLLFVLLFFFKSFLVGSVRLEEGLRAGLK